MREEYITPVGAGTPEKGRKEVPYAVAFATQFKLMDLMIPDSIRPYLTKNPEEDLEGEDPILVELGNRWMEKYAAGFNGFTEYCNAKSADREFMERAKLGQFTASDYTDMINFFEKHEHGEPFFKSEAEVQEFLKLYVH